MANIGRNVAAIDRNDPAAAPILAVAVGVLIRADGTVLITRRSPHAALGGLWEFPGGKLEAGETVVVALRRELHEELGIVVQDAEPALQVHHSDSVQTVILHVWQVHTWHGTPHGREGQPLRWVKPEQLSEFAFPAADTPIITWLQQTPSQADLPQRAQQASPKSISTAL